MSRKCFIARRAAGVGSDCSQVGPLSGPSVCRENLSGDAVAASDGFERQVQRVGPRPQDLGDCLADGAGAARALVVLKPHPRVQAFRDVAQRGSVSLRDDGPNLGGPVQQIVSPTTVRGGLKELRCHLRLLEIDPVVR
eukprot:167334-Pyramimonas_sp.AAC.1